MPIRTTPDFEPDKNTPPPETTSVRGRIAHTAVELHQESWHQQADAVAAIFADSPSQGDSHLTPGG